MTSMFDQYEQDSQKQRIVNINTIPPGMTTSGYIQMTSQEETPIFEKQKLSFNPLDRITHLAVSNDYLVLAMANNILFRMDLQNPERHEEITLTKNSTSSHLTNLFLDPLGQHLLLSYGPRGSEGSTELLYLPRKNSKLRPTTKFRNHEITAVAWNHTNDSDLRTGPILLGTSRGLIFETEITMDGDGIFQTSIEKYWQQVFDIGKGSNIPITGLEYHQVSKTERYFILVTTANRLYQFIGNANSDEKPLLQQIFNSYLNVQDSIKEEIKSSLKYSKLNFCYQQKGIPKTFALLTEPGIFWGELDPYGREDINNVVNINEIIEYPGTNNMSDSPQKPPIPSAFVITAFHALLLYSDNVKGISLLNKELIFEENYSEKLVNITKDPARGTIWVFTERTIYRYKVTREERNVWKIYCDKGQFDLAKKYCQDNPAHLDRVLVKEAEVLFDNGDYLKSAQRYANTQSSFEEICLKFLQKNQLNALKKFLEQKLDKLKTQDKTQITLIVLWVIELFLNQLGQLRNNGEQTSDKYSNLQKEFDAFLATNIVTECVRSNKQTVYDLMASHGDKHNLIKLTIVNKDFEQVIRQHIYKNDYREALEVLGSQSKRDLYYQFIPILMQEIPKQTVSALISQGRTLSPIKLLPALVGCDADEIHINETIRYLEFCVLSLGSTERAIHNYLLSLYVKHKPEKLKEYLATQGQDSSMIFYDVHYTLRLCLEKGLTEACVQLSALLGLWESAVDLALTVSIDLAKQTANMPDSDNELKKKLWLKIAKHVVSGKNDIQQAMEFLQQCDLIKIEDILPFFSDFDTIDHFKDAICTSLQEYNQHIQDLKEEMEEATKSAEMIRNEIQAFRNRCSTIGVDDTCAICNLTLIIRPFYYFPCTHKFHSDCLLAELRPLLGPANSNKLADLNRQLAMLSNTADNVSMGSASLSARDQVKADIDNIIASECLYCGEYMIRDIDAPFIEDREFETIVKDWA